MIRHFEFGNFCSYRETAAISFAVSASVNTDDSFAPSLLNDRVSLLMGVFGANASGKTNLLKGLVFFSFFLRHSYQHLGEKDEIPVDGFFHLGRTTPVSCKIEFEGNGGLYRYECELLPTAVVSEKLSQFHLETGHFRTLMARDAEGKVTARDFDVDRVAISRLIKDRPNASMFAAGLLTGSKEIARIDRALGIVETNVNRTGKKDSVSENELQSLIEAAAYFDANPHLKENLEQRLITADLGISGFAIKKTTLFDANKKREEEVPFPFVRHRVEGAEVEFPLVLESSGTKRLFLVLRRFFPVLTDGGIAVIDEMESDMHPHLIPTLLDLFADPELNPKKAQLLFTCHHVEILNRLAKEQIVLVEKDANCVSHAKRLSDIPGVRREENFFARYNAGYYGAIPQPAVF
ncbi:MAG: ATP-binding protein [Verrucomicrobia bacterium]|nr:ATP-binding protein [Verrucomicrobiota bacterium]